MKRFACGLLAFGLAVSLAGCENSAPAWDMEVPEYPWTLTCDEFAASLQEQGAGYDRQQSGAGYSITLPEGTLYSVPVDAVALYFNADQMLESISASVPAASRDSLLDAVQDALGEPADSYRPAVMNMLSQNFSVYCSSEMVQDGLSYVWHSARPLSESWSDELRAQFAEQLRHNYEEAGVSFAEQDAGTITVNGEEQTQWYGSEAFDSYFANNWEFVAMFQGAEGEDVFRIGGIDHVAAAARPRAQHRANRRRRDAVPCLASILPDYRKPPRSCSITVRRSTPQPLAGEALGELPPERLPCKGSCRRQPTEGCCALPCQYPFGPP